VTTDKEGFSRALDWGLRTTLLIAVPAMFGLMILSVPLVATIFQHGRFTAFDTKMASLSISALSFGLPAFALVKVVLPAFYARKDTKTPVRAGVASLVANMVFNVAFLALLFFLWASPAQKAGSWMEAIATIPGLHMALGMASALASYLNLLLLWRWLGKAGVYARQPGWSRHLVRLGVACAVMVSVLLAGLYVWPEWSAVEKWERVWRLAALVGAGGGAYVGTLFAMGFRLRDLRAQ
jgi:putative peptidoglycan lipid II flippase